MKTKVIAVTNFKGGAGKTTVAVNLAHALTIVDKNLKVLIIDSDMQMNSTNTLGFKQNREKSIHHALLNEITFDKYIQTTKYNNLDIVISDFDMAFVDLDIFTKRQREILFKKLLQPVIEKCEYDYIIIDTNPSLGLVNQNVMIASDYALIPVELSKFGIQGLSTITKFFKKAVLDINKDFKILGVVINKVNLSHTRMNAVAIDVIKTVFEKHLLNTQIGVDTKIGHAQWKSMSIMELDATTRASKDIINLAKEVIENA